MTRLRSALRITLGLGALALAGSAGCSSAPTEGETGSTSEEMSIIRHAPCAPGYGYSCNPICTLVCVPDLTTEATAPDAGAPDTSCHLDQPFPVPPELAGEGCTLGGEYYLDYTAGSPFNVYPKRIWACPAGAAVPTHIAGGEDPNGYLILTETSFDSRCLGNPLPGWKFIVQDPLIINHSCNGGCPH